MKRVFNDGGRYSAGFRGTAGDCVARAIAIVARRSYAEVHAELALLNESMRKTRRRVATTGTRTADRGIYTQSVLFKRYMVEHGFVWTPTMSIGSGCTVHLRDGELPAGRLIVAVSKHYTSVIDGVIHDTHNVSRGGNRCVYGYWRKA